MDKIQKATHEGPLVLAGIEIPAFVLEDGTRLISQRGLQKSIGLSRSGGRKAGAHRMGTFLGRLIGKGIQINELDARIEKPIIFRPSHGGRTAHGYEATVLADICDVVFEANKRGKLLPQQKHVAERCEMLMRAFAKVGIIALIDEATGYQEIRDKLALQEILDKYLRQEWAKWAKRFPDEFYMEMFRLKGWQWRGMSINRPILVGKYTDDIVYQRLAPGVRNELRKVNPKDDTGRRKQKHHQWLTEDIGVPALSHHLTGVMALMRAAPNYETFKRMLARAFPKPGQQLELPYTKKED